MSRPANGPLVFSWVSCSIHAVEYVQYHARSLLQSFPEPSPRISRTVRLRYPSGSARRFTYCDQARSQRQADQCRSSELDSQHQAHSGNATHAYTQPLLTQERHQPAEAVSATNMLGLACWRKKKSCMYHFFLDARSSSVFVWFTDVVSAQELN